MDLEKHYNHLYTESIQKIESDSYSVDHLIDEENDKRFGLTLILRPNKSVRLKIQQFLEELNKIDAYHYIYKDAEMHVTVMAIISCQEGYTFHESSRKDYIEIIEQSLSNASPFQINFQGLTASPSCILVQGFPENHMLNQIRENLRQNFKSSFIEQTIDKRYTIQTAHSTILRLRDKISNKQAFMSKIKEYRNINFGSSEISTLELVYNDWYHRTEKVKSIHTFTL